MAHFLDLEAEVEGEEDLELCSNLVEDCYSEKFSSDDDFIDDSEEPSKEEIYGQLIEIVHDTVERTFGGIDSKTRHTKYNYSRVKKEEEEERMSSKVDKLAEKALAKRKKEKEVLVTDSPISDHASDGEFDEKQQPPPPPKKIVKIRKKPPVMIEPEEEEEEANEPQSDVEEIAVHHEGEEPDFDPADFGFEDENAVRPMDNDLDPMFFDDEQEIDLTNPDAVAEVKCGICARVMNKGWSDKSNAPYLYCQDKENCHFAWMTFDRSIEFHRVAPKIIAAPFRTPFPHGRPRCRCNRTMLYRWVEKASDERAPYLVGNVFLECCVPKKDGGPCDKVLFVGKCDTREEREEMAKLYIEEKEEYLRKKEEAEMQIKLKIRELQRDKRLRTGVYTSTIRSNVNSNKALKDRLKRIKTLKKQFSSKK